MMSWQVPSPGSVTYCTSSAKMMLLVAATVTPPPETSGEGHLPVYEDDTLKLGFSRRVMGCR